MGRQRDPDWLTHMIKFHDHFHYICSTPPNVGLFNQEDCDAFCKMVDKCIEDDFDYTIEAYGTRPCLFKGMPEYIIN